MAEGSISQSGKTISDLRGHENWSIVHATLDVKDLLVA